MSDQPGKENDTFCKGPMSSLLSTQTALQQTVFVIEYHPHRNCYRTIIFLDSCLKSGNALPDLLFPQRIICSCNLIWSGNPPTDFGINQVMPWSVPGLPSSRDPLHPFIFVFELISVTFTSPLHLINSWELFWGRCNHGRGARYCAVCVLLADSSCVMFRIWTSFGSFVLVWRSADLRA